MKHKQLHILIGVITGFIALTAIGGGVAMLLGADQFPLEWLRDTPFSDYTIPALILMFGVGGSSLIAAVTIFTGREMGVLVSMIAGLLIMGYITVEVVILKQTPPGPTWIEGIYFTLGLFVVGLVAYLWRSKTHDSLTHTHG